MAVSATANSDHPPAPSGVLRQDNQKQPTSKNRNPQEDQRGTEQLPIVIKIAPDPKAQDEAAQTKRER